MTPLMPPPSAELVICRVGIEALIEVLGRKKGEQWLTLMADKLVVEDRLSNTIKLRPPADDEAVQSARRDAIRWFRACMPLFMARLQ